MTKTNARIMSYRIETCRALGGGWRALAFVGPKRNVLAAVTRRYYGRAGAEQACINLMRKKRHGGKP